MAAVRAVQGRNADRRTEQIETGLRAVDAITGVIVPDVGHGTGRRDEPDDTDIDVAVLVDRALCGYEPDAVMERFPAQRLQRSMIVVGGPADRHLQVVGVCLDRLEDLLPFLPERCLEKQPAVSLQLAQLLSLRRLVTVPSTAFRRSRQFGGVADGAQR